MELKKLVLVTTVVAAITGLYGCGSDERATVNIDAQDNSTTNTSTGGGGDTGSTVNCPSEFSFLRQDVNGNDVCQLNASIMADATLTSDITWFLGGAVVVGNGNQQMSATDGTLAEDDTPVEEVTLTIQPGTSILADNGTFANLTITRGSNIIANGTASSPIVFSSEDAGFDGAGEWGGLIIHGYGLHNECRYIGDGGADEPTTDVACNVDAEGESGLAGGHDNTDDSGSLSYVVVTEGGYEFAVGNEINGISFVGVGNGTTVNNIQVNNNADDGVEFYGGSVNAKYLVLTGNQDDSIDWDEGYVGNIQYALVVQSSESNGNTIEADTFGSDRILSAPTIVNATFVGNGGKNTLHVLKAGSGGFIHNSIMTGASGTIENCVLLDGEDVVTNAQTGNIAYNNTIADCTNFEITDETGPVTATNLDTAESSPNLITGVAASLDTSYASTATEATGLTAIDFDMINTAFPGSKADGTFFDDTTYIGAIEPGSTPWYEGWIVEGSL
ncbi:hypothetical protein [Marinibactrum halimedae]|uniref:Uncharacterized protein n=1 Tax=Marinibactrum halimedae TaxID=1444977 RepID=A0AA37WLT2_9GAMM|nr:hypothetical protein [Marinibactrum halimedae]MCD9458666.1 hypothetical protein [Marinibactrum halimedae]GLS25968.1 hypothetical protein GCM10007877_16830 [Marinibactrum halimedae]